MQATRAAGAMLISADSSDAALFWAAALVHSIVSLFWAAVLTWTLPRKYTFWWALVAAAGIAVLDLRVLKCMRCRSGRSLRTIWRGARRWAPR